MREQAEQVVGRYASSERSVLLVKFRQIVKLTSQRMDAPEYGAPAHLYLVRVHADPTDPMAQVMDDRGTVQAWALRFADDRDSAVAHVWREVMAGFDSMHFERRLED